MDNESYKNYQSSMRALLNKALVEALKRNESQTKTWKDYRKAHEKVKKGLEILPQELTTNCMVPIGRKALMKGKLVHTNEILVCLGEGYFAKYSAKQAIGVCDRRIKQADEMIINLEKEQNLLEMRQIMPVDYGIFGDEETQEIIETYVEEEEKEWRIKHRQREKEYRQKLAQLRAQEKTEIQSEQDLWQRLDELELQEELEDEIDRLQANDCNYYGDDNEDKDDSYEEEDSDFSEDETTTDMIKERLDTLKNGKIPKHQKDLMEKENFDKEADCDSSTYDIPGHNQPSSSSSNRFQSSETSLCTSEGGSTDVRDSDLSQSSSQSGSGVKKTFSGPVSTEEEVSAGQNNDADDQEASKSETRRRRVSFTDKIQVNVFEMSRHHSFDQSLRKERESSDSDTDDEDEEKLRIIEDMISAGVDSISNEEQIEDSTENGEEDDDIIRIEVKHSDRRPRVVDRLSGDDVIEDPSDIYRIFSKPKSILKKSSSDVSYTQNITPPADDVFDQKIDDVPFGTSYTVIVKDVEERKPEAPEVNVPSTKSRPPSRFKMARSGIK